MRGKNPVETANEYLGREENITIGEIRGPGETIDTAVDLSHAEMEAFMHETLTVMVHESSDENDQDIVHVSVNGVSQYFRRGVPQDVKRKFVERLARAKRTDYSQNLDDMVLKGERVNVLTTRNSLRFPFQVINDPNPKGAGWLKGVLAERN